MKHYLKHILDIQYLLFWQKHYLKQKNKNKNDDLVIVIKSGLRDLENEIKKMSENEKEAEKPDKILKIV